MYIDPEAQLVTMGLDSLMVLELRDVLQAEAGIPLPSTLAYLYVTFFNVFMHPRLITIDLTLPTYDAITVSGLVKFIDSLKNTSVPTSIPVPTTKPIQQTVFGPQQATIPAKEQVAIVGIACKFPGGVNSPQSFWEMLKSGVDTVAEIPAERWGIVHHQHIYEKLVFSDVNFIANLTDFMQM